MVEAKKNIIEVYYEINVDCPSCKKTMDLTENNFDDDGVFSKPLFTNRWDEVKGIKIECIHCDNEFKIDGMEY